jgi:selenide,water dikinase
VKRLILAGGGHAHAAALLALAKAPPAGLDVTLVSPDPCSLYSGMLPGVIAEHYKVSDAEIDLAPLAASAGARFFEQPVVSLDLPRRALVLGSGERLEYDLLSLDVGATARIPAPGALEHGIPLRPFYRFLERAAVLYEARIAVIGGGPAGVEMAMALRRRGNALTVYSDRQEFPPALAPRIAAALRRTGVSHIGLPASRVEPGPLVFAGSAEATYDAVVLAAGATPLSWLRDSGLATDGSGFVRVDRALRSVSHPEVFAAGDCATLDDAPHPKAGVFAVRHGAVLAHNVRALAEGKPLRAYQPQAHFLSIISCGVRYAIAQRGAFAAEGRWVWQWKDWIDRRWMKSFRR